MNLRFSMLATVAAIIMSFSSSLLAGDADAVKEGLQRKQLRNRPEVSCELKVREKYQYYEVDGGSAAELRRQMKRSGTKWNDGRTYAAVTSWDIRYRYDISFDEGKCSVKWVKTDVDIVYQLPRRIALKADPELSLLWEDYMLRLKEHEYGHKDLAVKAAAEINQALSSLENFGSQEELEQEARRRADEKLRQLKEVQVKYDDDTRHGETQGAILDENRLGMKPAAMIAAH